MIEILSFLIETTFKIIGAVCIAIKNSFTLATPVYFM